MSDILYKAYMDRTVICCTLAMNTIIIVLYSCMINSVTVLNNYKFTSDKCLALEKGLAI